MTKTFTKTMEESHNNNKNNSDLSTEQNDNNANKNQTRTVPINSMPAINSKKSSLVADDDFLSDVTNPFESAPDSLSLLTNKLVDSNTANTKMAFKKHSIEVDTLNTTFDKIDLVKLGARTSEDFRRNSEDMTLSGQEMPNVESMKPDLFDEDEDQQLQSEELFQDAAAYDFLLNIGNSNKNSRDFSKESLFLKFDPLLGKSVLPTGLKPDRANINKTQKLQSTNPTNDNSENASLETVQCGSELTNVSSASMSETQYDKESSKVSPAPSKETLKTPLRNSAIEVLDRLISLTPSAQTNIPLPEPVKEPKIDAEKMQYIEELKQLRQIITKHEQEFEQMRQQLDEEKNKVEQLSNKEQALVKRIAEKTKLEQQMGVVMSEYEKNIAQLIADRELEKQKLEEQVKDLSSERDVAMQHLSSVENAFTDVHQKYERCKVIIEQFKTNEETLKTDNAHLRDVVKQQDNRYDTLKAHAISQLDKANADLETLKRKQEMEVVKWTALLKKADLKTISLQEALTQKQKENEELMAICDGLIQKVG